MRHAAGYWRNALLVHGAGGGGWEWNVWKGVFEAHGIAIASPDLAPSNLGLAATTMDDYLLQVRHWLAALERPRVLIGASMGGLLAAMGAEDADALVLINPLPPSPLHHALPPRAWAAVVAWHGQAQLSGTSASIIDADAVSAIYAFRHWRDEAGAVLQAAYAGVHAATPQCPALVMWSAQDVDVPPDVSAALAQLWGAERLETVAASHAGPLLGRAAAADAAQAVAWLNRLRLREQVQA